MAIAPTNVQVDSLTITGSTDGAWVPNTQFRGVVATIHVSAKSGTAPVLSVRLQTSDPFDNVFDLNLAEFPPIVATGDYQVIVHPSEEYIQGRTIPEYIPGNIRFHYEVSGTTPSFTVDTGFIFIE